VFDVKRATIRQLRGKASSVLDFCDCGGAVAITRPDGRVYVIKRLTATKTPQSVKVLNVLGPMRRNAK